MQTLYLKTVNFTIFFCNITRLKSINVKQTKKESDKVINY